MKLRIKFKKYGKMIYIGHLDLLRYFQKSIRRAGIDIAYSEGFSPHQIMSFAAPLGVGTYSNAEYCDIVVNSATSAKEMIKALNDVNVEGVEIVNITKLEDGVKNAMATVANADYIIDCSEKYLEEVDINRIDEFYNQAEINVFKKTKRSAKISDLKPMINDMKLMDIESDCIRDASGNEKCSAKAKVFLSLKTGSVANLKPELVMDAFWQYCNGVKYDEAFLKDLENKQKEIDLLRQKGKKVFKLQFEDTSPHMPDYSISVTRNEIYDENMVSLDKLGTDF